MKKILLLAVACSMGSMLWQTNLLGSALESVDANRQAQAARVGAATTADEAYKAMHGDDANQGKKYVGLFGGAEPEQPKPVAADKSAEVKPTESKYAAGKKRVNALKAELKEAKVNLKKVEAGLGLDLIQKKTFNDGAGSILEKYTSEEKSKLAAWEKAKANVRAKRKELKKAKLNLKKEKVKKTVKGVIKKVMPKKNNKANAPKKSVVHGRY
jgi:hypothetical protein